MKRYLLILSASIAFVIIATVFNVLEHREIEQLRVDKNSLTVQNADLQRRINAQLEIDRREEERLKHADEIADREIGAWWPKEEFDTIEEETRRWEDAGCLKFNTVNHVSDAVCVPGMSWGEFDRAYAREQLRRLHRDN